MSPGEDVRDYYRNQGRLEERERIIKILMTNQCEDENHPGECITFIQNVDQYVALIKGDK
jgi:hypothetical protein